MFFEPFGVQLSKETTANFPQTAKTVKDWEHTSVSVCLPTIQYNMGFNANLHKIKLNCEFNISMKDNMGLTNLKSLAPELSVGVHKLSFGKKLF